MAVAVIVSAWFALKVAPATGAVRATTGGVVLATAVKNREGDPDDRSFAVVVTRGKYRFYPIGDTTSVLEPLNTDNQLAEDFYIGGTSEQDLSVDAFGFQPFNPSRYRLTTAAGYAASASPYS